MRPLATLHRFRFQASACPDAAFASRCDRFPEQANSCRMAAAVHCVLQKPAGDHPVSGAFEKFNGQFGRNPVGCVLSLSRQSDAHRWATQVHAASLSGPQVVFRHVREAPVNPDSVHYLNDPSGFLESLSVQCTQRRLACVDTAAGQLKFGVPAQTDA